MRLLIQSVATGCFLVPDESWGARWEPLLINASSGIFDDYEQSVQLIRDYVAPGDKAIIINLDEL